MSKEATLSAKIYTHDDELNEKIKKCMWRLKIPFLI